MTPAARVAAAIEVLDLILDGVTPEKALTGWGRTHRFAGSKDRAAIRDHVFDALRRRASFAWLGGADTGRGIMIGAMRAVDQLEAVFTGEGHAPRPLDISETGAPLVAAPRDVAFDMPDWLISHFDAAYGADADAVLATLTARAAVFLRVNTARATVAEVQTALGAEGITTGPVPHVKTALQVTENERRIALSAPYLSGLVELQDASSQAAIAAIDITPGLRVLDYCAGGGGKALAMAARGADVTAFDIDARRMVDLPVRADRAGVSIGIATPDDLAKAAPFDLVLCDAPCSGSGTWRRTPAAKWALTSERLQELTMLQDAVLQSAAPLVRVGGTLAYATCSVFDLENTKRIQVLTTLNAEFKVRDQSSITPHALGDGFFMATLTRQGIQP